MQLNQLKAAIDEECSELTNREGVVLVIQSCWSSSEKPCFTHHILYLFKKVCRANNSNRQMSTGLNTIGREDVRADLNIWKIDEEY